MSTHTETDAGHRLSELIDRVLQGGGIVITRRGRPVAELRPVPAPARPVSASDLDWLAARRVGRPPVQDAGSLVSGMRDGAC